ncbi:MAG: hypothetical protein J07AB43_01900 [Candidatus Nanosalina sp. J07AB43]|nr:MAG: hypothetical protein J07AB43_01900 [Candidatus Nanosalina sp. J07AB43]
MTEDDTKQLELPTGSCCMNPNIQYQVYSLSQCMNCGEVIAPDNHDSDLSPKWD